MAGGAGITATREGLTKRQRIVFSAYLRLWLNGPICIDHGDCLGGDEEAHKIAMRIPGMFIRIHPPTDEKLRAFCKSHWIAPPKPYLERNKDIVNNTNFLIALPGGFTEEKRSGTWSTVRYAMKQKKNIHIIYPSGEIEYRTPLFNMLVDAPMRLEKLI